ncbi:MAG: CatB-related O-acetyltransferase [Methanobacterium sp.]
MRIISLLKNKLNIKKSNRLTCVEIGKHTYGYPTVYNWRKKHKLFIGKFCSISTGVKVIVDGNHRIDWISSYPFGEKMGDVEKNPEHPFGKGDVEIGNDVWIGIDVLILSGVKIGDGAVIGARSVVTKNISDYEVVAGNPAKHIKYRFNKEQRDALKMIKWWDWPLEKIKDNINLLESEDIEEFIEKFRK